MTDSKVSSVWGVNSYTVMHSVRVNSAVRTVVWWWCVKAPQKRPDKNVGQIIAPNNWCAYRDRCMQMCICANAHAAVSVSHTSQSYSSLSCSMIHSSSTSLFRSSFRSYFTVTLPCFFCTGSSRGTGPLPTQPTPGAVWKNTRPGDVGIGADGSGLAADMAQRSRSSGGGGGGDDSKNITSGASKHLLFKAPRELLKSVGGASLPN